MADNHELDSRGGSAVYAHELVQRVMDQVKRLEIDWVQRRRNPNNEDESINNIEEVIVKLRKTTKFIDKETAISVFRYFCASRIFAKYLAAMFLDDWEPQFANCNFTNLDNLNVNQTTLTEMDNLAKKMLAELEFEENKEHNESDGAEADGKRAALRSPGSIPFMLVYSDQKRLVYFRRNVELINEIKTKSKFIKRDNLETIRLLKLPLVVTKNGQPVPGYLKKSTLREVIPNKDFRKKLFEGKWITQLHVEIDGARVVYEFDLIDSNLYMNPSNPIGEKELVELSGVSRSADWAIKDDRHFCQEDIIISYFSDILFSGQLQVRENRLQGFEKWNDKLIRSVIKSAIPQENVTTEQTRNGNPMYIGFCFKTIIEGGYADERAVQGSTNLLLMALTRGFVQLAKNSQKSRMFMGKEVINYLENEDNRKYEEETEIFPPVIVRKHKHYNHPHFIGATSKGITVRTKLPFRFCIVVLISIGLILIYGILLGKKQLYDERVGNDPNWEEYWSGLFGLTTSVIAVALLVTKVIYKSWELTDMFHQRRHAKCFAELEAVIEGGWNTALEVCSLLENPEEVFSKWRSCAFADGSYGEFEIDTDIYVNNLLRIGQPQSGFWKKLWRQFSNYSRKTHKLRGFIFGVDYYGNCVVADMLGRIRKVEFPDPVCENWDSSEPLTNFAQICAHFDEHDSNQKSSSIEDRRHDLSRWIFPWIRPTSLADKSLFFRKHKKKRFSDAGYIHIGSRHELNIEHLFKMPIANLSVGSVRQDASRHGTYETPIGPNNYYEMV